MPRKYKRLVRHLTFEELYDCWYRNIDITIDPKSHIARCCSCRRELKKIAAIFDSFKEDKLPYAVLADDAFSILEIIIGEVSYEFYKNIQEQEEERACSIRSHLSDASLQNS